MRLLVLSDLDLNNTSVRLIPWIRVLLCGLWYIWILCVDSSFSHYSSDLEVKCVVILLNINYFVTAWVLMYRSSSWCDWNCVNRTTFAIRERVVSINQRYFSKSVVDCYCICANRRLIQVTWQDATQSLVSVRARLTASLPSVSYWQFLY